MPPSPSEVQRKSGMLPVVVLVAVITHLTVRQKGGRIYTSSWFSGRHCRILAVWEHVQET